ncbi:MAG: hypothetical protein AB7G15_09930 [Alphaproteobacteria bacterium]
MTGCDVLITGTGSLAETVLFAFATVDAKQPLQLAIGGRSAGRMNWLSLAANGRAFSFGLQNFTRPSPLDWETPEALANNLRQLRPRIIIQTASMQSPWTLGAKNDWARMIAAGGYGLATPMHTILTARLLRAVELAGLDTVIINGAFPDIANSILKAMGLPSPVGFGNVDLIAVSAMALAGERRQGTVQVLAQYEPHVAAFRLPPSGRAGMSARAWINGEEVADFQQRFAAISFPAGADDALNQLTGATVVPMALAYLDGRPYLGHATGPFGYPGGYPVSIERGRLSLRLPKGVSEAEAIAFNKAIEQAEGIALDEAAKRIRLSGKAHAAMHRHSPRLAEGYSVASLADLERAVTELLSLRQRLEAQSAA